ncbi:unnamed protein product [Choristocarpus tenellus]
MPSSVRANDDVYIMLHLLMEHLSKQRPFAVYMGFFIQDVRMCRPKDSCEEVVGCGSGSEGGGTLDDKSLCFSVSHYPANKYPSMFAQGNAIILSGDIAEAVGAIADQPWRAPMPDDVAVAMVAHSRGANLHALDASWSSDERPVECHGGAALHFDMEEMPIRRMHENIQAGRDVCQEVEKWRV